jgi:hypothetical protein
MLDRRQILELRSHAENRAYRYLLGMFSSHRFRNESARRSYRSSLARFFAWLANPNATCSVSGKSVLLWRWAALFTIAALALPDALNVDLGFCGDLRKIILAVARSDLIKG